MQYYAQVVHPPLKQRIPLAGQMVLEEGSHDYLEMVWPRSHYGTMPVVNEVTIRSPIAVKFGRRTGSMVTQEAWFYGYITDIAPSAKGVSVMALGATEHLKESHPRFFDSIWLSTLLNEVLNSYPTGLKGYIDGADRLIYGEYQGGTDWAFLNKIADTYGFALLSRPGQVVLRDRTRQVFSTPKVVLGANTTISGPTVPTARWMMLPVRSLNATALNDYVMANIDPRTGGAFAVRQSPEKWSSGRTRLVTMPSTSVADAHAGLHGAVRMAEAETDRATGVIQEGAMFLHPGNVLYSLTGRDEIDGLWRACRIEHTFGPDNEGSTKIEMARPPSGWRAREYTMQKAIKGQARERFVRTPRLINEMWRWVQ